MAEKKNDVGKKVPTWNSDFPFCVGNHIGIWRMPAWVRKTEVLTCYNLTFGDKSIRVLGLHIQNHCPKFCKSNHAFKHLKGLKTIDLDLNACANQKWVKMSNKWHFTTCLWYLVFYISHITCKFLIFQLLAKILNFKFIKY